MAMKETIRIQRSKSALIKFASVAPKAPAITWFRKVATKIPRMIVQGLRKRAARKTASSIVLSPISAAATTPVERSVV